MTDADLDMCGPFLEAITAQPGAALPRLIFADWLEEHGHDREAAGQRWAAKHGKYPHADFGWFPWHPESIMSSFKPARLPTPFFTGEHSPGYLYEAGWPGVNCERAYLRRCGELDWSPDGEPADPCAPPSPCPDAPAPDHYDVTVSGG